MNKLADKVQRDLIRAIDHDEMVLPTLPELALKVREAAQEPDIGLQALTKLIGSDAALTTRLIRAANSPLLRSPKKIDDLRTAIKRLGLNYTCNLATGLAMEQMFQASTAVVDRRMREAWNKSAEVAGICHVLARHYTRLAPDQATLAGLVHQIGVLPILTYAEDNNELLSDPVSLNYVIECIHPLIGEHILKAWNFPTPITEVPRNYLDFSRDSPSVDYSDIVQIATLQSYLNGEHAFTRLDWSRIPAFAKLGLDPHFDMREDTQLASELEAATSLIQ